VLPLSGATFVGANRPPAHVNNRASGTKDRRASRPLDASLFSSSVVPSGHAPLTPSVVLAIIPSQNPRVTQSERGRGDEIRIRFADLPESDITEVNGFRVTTLVRTLIDLSAETEASEAARYIEQAIEKGLITLNELIDAATRRTDIEWIEDFRNALSMYLRSRSGVN
jgi:hypothetical protein